MQTTIRAMPFRPLPPPPPSTHRKTGVRRGLSSFREGGALDDEGKSVRTVECSSVGPWPWCERTDCLSSARCRVLRRRFFVECSLSCAALRMRGVGGFLRHSCFLTPSVFQGARSAGSESALRWAAFWVTHFRGLALLALHCIPAVCEQMVCCLVVQSCRVSL